MQLNQLSPRILTTAFRGEIPVQKTITALDQGRSPCLLSGTGSVHRALLAAALRADGRKLLILCADENEAGRLAGDVSSLTGEEVCLLPSREWVFRSVESVSRETERKRLTVMQKILSGSAGITVATPDGLLQRTVPPALFSSACFCLRDGEEYSPDDAVARLTLAGYSRALQVEGPGQYAVRGGILDFWSPGQDSPVRCEFFGDEVDSLGSFDVETQRRQDRLETVTVVPAAETLVSLSPGGKDDLIASLERLLRKLKRHTEKEGGKSAEETVTADLERLHDGREFAMADRYLELLYPMATAADYFDETTSVLLCEPQRLTERAKNWAYELSEDVLTLTEAGVLAKNLCSFSGSWEGLVRKLEALPTVMADSFTLGSYPMQPRNIETLLSRQLPSYGGSLDTAAEDIRHYQKLGGRVLVLAGEERRCGILAELLIGKGIHVSRSAVPDRLPEPGECMLTIGSLSAGCELTASGLTVITEGQITGGGFRKKVRKRSAAGKRKLDSFTDLSPGDLVVHRTYGIGRFTGFVKLTVDKVEKDYVKIAFSGSDALYVPATQLDAVTKYIGGGEDKPVKLSRLGGTDWTKTKAKAKGAAKEMAQQLIQVQAKRKRQPGYAFSPDSAWQTEFETGFPFEETDDQLRSVQEIKSDMEKPVPMDRLLCGDVGYGKTEVALRAVMKCVLDGKQAAILVPTTVLAQQHYQTAMSRFSSYPVSISVLSRFRSSTQVKDTLRGLENGSVDLVIGTHRLIQKDIRFKNLGLVIIDEEQRFGVEHKEKLKALAGNVDVLTLSATPIPRTLNMALSGLRDMSTLEEPPQDRQPVQTYVLEHDWSVLTDAIRREVGRGGQVYYLHNRVETIDRTAAKLAAMLEDVSVGVAHGKMDEASLGRVMEQMVAGELSVLVCTTIIETGIDIPNVNTLIIEDADKMGLSQLHQIRGRVGRSSRRAYAYFTFRRGKVLTEIAEKRLSAIREFAEFNSGFKIAMRDLEIRGAGNLLGAEQSGHIYSVGFDLYLQLLEEAVLEEQGGIGQQKADCSADLTVAAGIPEEYVDSAELRMDLYRRIAHIRTKDEANDMTDELIDRFGDPPKQVTTLIRVALLRGEAVECGITEISQKQGTLEFKLGDFSMERISAMYLKPQYKGRLRVNAGSVPSVIFKLPPGADPVNAASMLVRDYREAK